MDASNNLIKEIKRIKEMGWVKSVNNNTSGIGLTLEHLLGKEYNPFQIPDYENIELKAKTNGSRSKITLFSATPDSYIFEIKRIKDTYGYPDKKDPSLKVFNMTFYGNKWTSLGNHFNAIIKVDHNNRIVKLCIFDKFGKTVDEDVSWSFDLLNDRLNQKLKYLLVVKADKNYYNGDIYYKYTEAYLYTLKCFDSFIDALEKGIIGITFKIGAVRSGDKYGQISDHGTGFDIEEKNLDKIFYKIK